MSNDLKYTLSLKDLFTKQMSAAIAATDKLDDKMSKLSSGLGSQLSGVFAGIGVAALGQQILEVGSSFERAEIGLKTLLHSSVKAKEVFEDLKQSAVQSPFSFETLLEGNKLLISTGISAEQAKKDFNGLANAIAATGGTEDTLSRMAINLQQIKNVGRATALDIKQFGFAGINIYGILDKYSKKHKINLDMENVSYEDITKALNEAGQAGGQYYGALDNLANSTSGRLSNLKDAFKNTLYDVFVKLSPMINSIVLGITSFFNFIKNNLSVIAAFAKTIGIIVGLYFLYNSYLKLNIWYNGLSTAAIVLNTLATEGASAAMVALNIAMTANPFGVLLAGIGLLVLAWNLYSDSLDAAKAAQDRIFQSERVSNGIQEEISRVNDLAKAYEGAGMKKGEALKKALSFEIETTKGAISQLEGKAGSENDLKVLYAQQSVLQRMGSKFGLSAESGGSKKDAANPKLGTGVSVSAARPQNLTINITKLIETMNLRAADLRDSAIQIKEEVAKALLEAVNDVNTVTR